MKPVATYLLASRSGEFDFVVCISKIIRRRGNCRYGQVFTPNVERTNRHKKQIGALSIADRIKTITVKV